MKKLLMSLALLAACISKKILDYDMDDELIMTK